MHWLHSFSIEAMAFRGRGLRLPQLVFACLAVLRAVTSEAAEPIVSLAITNPVLRASSGQSVSFAGFVRSHVPTNLPLANLSLYVDTLPQEDSNLVVRIAPEFLEALGLGLDITPQGYAGPLVKVDALTSLSPNWIVTGRLALGLGDSPSTQTAAIQADFALNPPRVHAARLENGVRLTWPPTPSELGIETTSDPHRLYSWKLITNGIAVTAQGKALTNALDVRTRYYRLAVP
jgi:hypothetical protein